MIITKIQYSTNISAIQRICPYSTPNYTTNASAYNVPTYEVNITK